MAIRKVIPRSLDSAAASANLSFDANTLYVDSTNNAVGINLTNPSSYATGGLATYNATNSSLAIVSGNANTYLRLYSTSDTDMYLSNIGGTMTFSTAATSRMTINSSGNVSIVGNASIGTTSPTPLVGAGKYLTLSNNSHATLSIQAVDGGNDRNATLELLGSGNGISYSQIIYGDTDITPGTPSPLIFTGYHSGTATERMRLTATGNLGIGISPSYRLDVSLGGATAGIVDTARFYADASAGAEARILFGSFANAVSSAIGAQSDSGTTGILKFYTDTAGSLTEKMRIDGSTGNVGIGTGSPATKLEVSGGSVSAANFLLNVTAGTYGKASDTSIEMRTSADATAQLMIFRVNGNNERMRITADGKVGIGNGSPAAQNLHVGSGAGGSTAINGYTRLAVEASDYAVTTMKAPAANFSQIIFADSATTNLGGINYYNSTNATPNAMAFFTGGGNERMRIDTSGNLFVNQTSLTGAEKVGISFDRGSSWGLAIKNTSATGPSNATFVSFYYTSTNTGSINSTGTTTSYGTSSDYRLKESVTPITNALNKVSQLKPSNWVWKSNGSTGQGFIAHELQEVIPDAVVGTKDQMDEDGNPHYQCVDTSFLIATLTAAIQEQQALITQLQADVAALKAK